MAAQMAHEDYRHIAVFKQFEVEEYISTWFWHRLWIE